jgi:endo-1,4-beta-xylanase
MRNVRGLVIFVLVVAISGSTVAAARSCLDKDYGNSLVTPAAFIPSDSQNLLRTGNFTYLPGAHYINNRNALDISPINLRIVSQEGASDQANPPVNLYGTRLNITDSDFTVRAQISNLDSSTAALQLYGKVPIIADEFRIERGSVRAEISGNTLTIKTWANPDQNSLSNLGNQTKNQTPNMIKTFKINNLDNTTNNLSLDISKVGARLHFIVNDVDLGTVPTGNIFDSKQVWFGFDAKNGSWQLTNLSVSGDIKVVDASKDPTQTTNVKSLQQLNKLRPDFKIGAAMALGPAVSDPDYAKVAFGGNFGTLTTENALKWQFTEPQENTFTYREADALVDIAKKNDMSVSGHTLVFAEANPAWVTNLPVDTSSDKQKVEAVMINHITNLVSHYSGKIALWDVVNEPINDDDNGLRNHIWYKAMGEDYIAKAFTAAHNADPDAKLFINEYGLENDGDRWDTLFSLVSKLKSNGVPIDGVGFQSHIYDESDAINVGELKQHIRQLADIGLVSRISEMDVIDDPGVNWQSNQYANVFDACYSDPSCISFTTWGVSDRYDYFIDDDRSIQQGYDFLWDENMNPTLAESNINNLIR